jgi:hypothetical protein
MCAPLRDLQFIATKHYLNNVEILPNYNSIKIMLNVINTAKFCKAIRQKYFNPGLRSS